MKRYLNPAILCAFFMQSLPVHAEVGTQIVGGKTSADHAYPFIVAVEYAATAEQFCDGTLLTPSKVLTAAHCVGKAATQVRLGTNNATLVSGQVVAVSSKTIHPKYNEITTDYDVAVLTLAHPVTLSDTINVVRLPEACASASCITGLAKPGTLVRVAGWGATDGQGNIYPNGLREVDIPIVSQSTCNSAMDGAVTARMMCAGYAGGGKDSCYGDSGGPLFGYLPAARMGFQAGIVSWGEGDCAQAGKYGVYTRISNPSIRAFIRQEAGV